MLTKKFIFAAGVTIAGLSVTAGAMAGGSDFFNSNDAGFVVGLQAGYADEHWSNLDQEIFDQKLLSFSDTGFAARGYVGYDINQYLGFEGGYTHLPKTGIDSSFGNSSIKNYVIDVLGKLSVHPTDVFTLYAKAGGSYFNSKTDSMTSSHIGPAFGVGAAYEIVPNLAIDVSWMRFSGQGEVAGNYQPNPDVALLGLSYKFPTHFS